MRLKANDRQLFPATIFRPQSTFKNKNEKGLTLNEPVKLISELENLPNVQ